MNIKISIIIPVFNREKYIARCLRSLLNQSIERRSYELIVINDGSIDKTQKIIRNQIKHRSDCGIKALQKLGVDNYVFHDLPCGKLDQEPVINIGKIIEREIRQYEPDVIFTHSKSDVNKDHQIVYQATLQSTRPGALNNVNFLLTYEVLSSSEWNFADPFAPNFFVEISKKDVDKKVEAMAEYDTEIKPLPFPRCEDMIRMKCNVRGSQIGVKNAEAFRLIRGLMR